MGIQKIMVVGSGLMGSGIAQVCVQAVEVVRGAATADDTLASGMAFVRSIGKEPIQVNRDVSGFVINRINFPSGSIPRGLPRVVIPAKAGIQEYKLDAGSSPA